MVIGLFSILIFAEQKFLRLISKIIRTFIKTIIKFIQETKNET